MRAIAPFVVRVFLWLAVAFALWYGAAKPVSLAASWVAGSAVGAFSPATVTDVEYRERHVVLVVEPDYETMRRNAMPSGVLLEVPVSPLLATYSLPFFLALMLATRPLPPAWKFACGFAVLLLVAGLGVGFEALKMLALLAGESGAPLFEFGRARREAFALGYQLGTLIVPSVLPLALWVAFNGIPVKTAAT